MVSWPASMMVRHSSRICWSVILRRTRPSGVVFGVGRFEEHGEEVAAVAG